MELMDGFERSQKVREAQRRLRMRRERAGMLRSRVIASALVAFVLLWGVVFAQMVTGNDPVLGARTAKHAAAGSVANEAISTTDPEELENEDVAPVEPESEPEVEVTPEEAQPEPEFFEPEPVETSQS